MGLLIALKAQTCPERIDTRNICSRLLDNIPVHNCISKFNINTYYYTMGWRILWELRNNKSLSSPPHWHMFFQDLYLSRSQAYL
jgi:hypothetical protein